MENKNLTPGDGYVDVKLSRAIEIGGVKTDTVRMREPLVSDQEAIAAMQGTDATREITSIANLCTLAPDEIRSMTMRDYKRLQAAYTSFID